MTVKELRQLLHNFDDNHTVVIKNERDCTEHEVKTVCWEYDGYCKIVLED